MGYLARVADQELAERLESAGAVVIEGARGCGKTETAMRAATSIVRLDIDGQARAAAELTPNVLLEQDPPLLIDEWQLVPSLWNQVRRAVDDRRKVGQFILTGSATPADDATRHSGAGRFSVLRMRPMSLAESGHSSAGVSLRDLLDGHEPRARNDGITVPTVADLVTVGGWPGSLGLPLVAASRAARDYLAQISYVDVPNLGGRRRDPTKIEVVLRSVARNVATEATAKSIAADAVVEGEPIDRNTVAAYLAIMERLMIVENQPAWSPAIRSRVNVRSSPKRHFVDPSLAVAALRSSPRKLLADLKTLGILFESLVVRDLRVLSQPLDGQVVHYRDNTGLEVDAIVTCDDGRWGAFEMKLGSGQIDSAAQRLLAFAGKVDTEVHGAPGVLAVITATGYAYRRPDGVAVVPVGTLGP